MKKKKYFAPVVETTEVLPTQIICASTDMGDAGWADGIIIEDGLFDDFISIL